MSGFQIQDGKGKNGAAEVNLEQQLVVRAITEAELEHASARLGSAYSWVAPERDLVAGETMLFVKNTGLIPLVLDSLHINGSNVACIWDVGIGGDATTPAGSLITPVNLNQIFSANTPEAIAYTDETAIPDAPVLMRIKTAADAHHKFDMTGVILGRGHYIQVNQETESTSGSCILIGHFEIPS